MVRADATQITRVLTNLAANAVRHTPSGGTVKIRAERESNQVRFWVEDTGQGIPADYLPKIFERFVQVPGATGGGAGLGLPISQAIVVAHGSEIKVESQVGEGSKFTFALAAD
jgi:signal transduction histidine kinase